MADFSCTSLLPLIDPPVNHDADSTTGADRDHQHGFVQILQIRNGSGKAADVVVDHDGESDTPGEPFADHAVRNSLCPEETAWDTNSGAVQGHAQFFRLAWATLQPCRTATCGASAS